ncbi:glycosyltransferase [Plantactinospora sp. KBS50]|uniref:glycosyltransferase n=1 Tax=Plantactinospora sp. KBS50 TaxID=2024580 RepID=UPI000BAB0E35|nr:glycosyltransferase [Plantactinospora sp. KBS50]ASW54505.1 hypothetical protein CIK06_10375 [Plantactinospora sp. KBS50]
MTVVLDVAGGQGGGHGRWRRELDAYLAGRPGAVRVLGRDRRLTVRWLVERERRAARADVVIASNNASFAVAGGQRRVLSRNALHFLHPSEEHLLRRMPRAWRSQVPVVRRLLSRADLVVASSSAMAERVVHHLPQLRSRVVVRLEPVTPNGTRVAGAEPYILVPVAPGPYKNLVPQLRDLVTVADRVGHPATIRVTAYPAHLPPELRAAPRIRPLGALSHEQLVEHWCGASAVFFPGLVESFGYPMAEARAYGLPVLAPDTGQSREVAGPALRGYRIGDLDSLAEALAAADEPVAPDVTPFDRTDYFDWLFATGTPRLGERTAPAGAVS